MRRKDNGNYVSSIYPPEFALVRPKRVNESIEQELVEFMRENEEKFEKSAMNRNFVFPRKFILSPNDSKFHPELILSEPNVMPSSTKSHRRHKSQENRYLDNNIYTYNSVIAPNSKNYCILQQTINTTSRAPYPKFKINSQIVRKNLKKHSRGACRKKRFIAETLNLNYPSRKNLVGLHIGNTYDHRRKLANQGDSLNQLSLNDTLSPKDSLILKKSKTRKTNKTPLSRYGKPSNPAVVGLSKYLLVM